jgi:hypothetical protein
MRNKELAEARTGAEEARWFDGRQDRLLKPFEEAEKEGALRVGGNSIGIRLSKKTGSAQTPPSPGGRPGDLRPNLHQNAAARGLGPPKARPAPRAVRSRVREVEVDDRSR